jgi:hypothetical protein
LSAASALKTAKRALKIAKRADRRSRKALRRARSGPRGTRGPRGRRGRRGRTGATGPTGTARAYAVVSFSGPSFVASKTKGFTGVTRPSTGLYCLAAPGLSPSTTPVSVTTDWELTAEPQGNAIAMSDHDGATSCPAATDFAVRTERFVVVGAASNAVEANDVGFAVLVP